jgi:hypothetical protein
MVATALLAGAVVTLAQLTGVAARSNTAARQATYATILAAQKLEQLRALAWGVDARGMPVSDLTTDTAAVPETPDGGTGLSRSPGATLLSNSAGWVDYVDRDGRTLDGGASPPSGTAYIRRWAVQPLVENPDTLVIQVLVMPRRDGGGAGQRALGRRPGQARVVMLRTRKGR